MAAALSRATVRPRKQPSGYIEQRYELALCYSLWKRRFRSGQNSRNTLEPKSDIIANPKATAPSPAVVLLLGCQAREMKAEPDAPPMRENEKDWLPLSWRARNVLLSAYF